MRNNNSMLSSPQHPSLISRCSILLQCEQFHKFMTLLKCKVEYSNSKELFIFPYFSCSFATTKAILDSSGVCQNIKSFEIASVIGLSVVGSPTFFSSPPSLLCLLLLSSFYCFFAAFCLCICAYFQGETKESVFRLFL